MKPIKTAYTFPFGETVTLVQQADRTPKRVFVVGVYASAVHAKWISSEGKTVVNALAVASEPYIFWRGENVESIIQRIQVPSELGTLVPAASNLNGPSGVALDELFLEPLGLSRNDAWLCDLVPHSCLNPNQKKAIERSYQPLMTTHNLPEVTLPPVPKQLADNTRREEILDEIRASRANTIILLGDEPIKWFLAAFDKSRKTLSDFGTEKNTYGLVHQVEIAGDSYKVLALVHPRQAGRLGSHSKTWHALHAEWINSTTRGLKI